MKKWLLYGLLIILVIVGISAIFMKGRLDDSNTQSKKEDIVKEELKEDNTVKENIENIKEDEKQADDSIEKLKEEETDVEEILLSDFSYLPIKEKVLHRAVMVSIENTPKARPQSGLGDAPIVYEFLVEGGITRFLALYWSNIPEKIGPIRSLRPYMIEIAQEYDALLLHAGASPDGFEMLKENDINNLDQIYNGKYYWRSQQRKIPHNLYTGEYRISDYLDKLIGFEYDKRFNFEEIIIISNVKAKAEEIIIDYWGSYDVLYKYNPEENNYYRFLKSEDNPHLCENNEQIKTNNIIIQFAKTSVKDDAGRLSIDLKGENKALYFRNGVVTEGYWVKEANSWTKYYDKNNNLITVNPGKTWIQIVPTNTNISYKEGE